MRSRRRVVMGALGLLLMMGIAGVLGGAALGRVMNSNSADLRLIEETTGLALPAASRDVEVVAVNYGHLYVISHLRLPNRDIPALVQRASATEIPPAHLWSELLRPVNRLTPELVAAGQWRYLRGTQGDYDWVGMLDESSGRLWLTLIPTCDPVTPTALP